MAVKLMNKINTYTGLAADTKPTSIAIGSTFFEYDTKLLYITHDGTNWVPSLGNNAFSVTTSFTRPDNATLYTIGDVMANVTPTGLTFANVGAYNGQIVTITNVLINVSVVQAVAPQFKLHLFSAAPVAVADNAALTVTDAEGLTVVASIPVINGNPMALNNTLQTFNVWYDVKLGAATTSLFGLLEVINGYTPAALTVQTITIGGLRL